MHRSADSAQSWLAVAGAVALGFALLGLAAFSQPLQRTVADDVSYEQAGEFSYSAPVPTGGIYDTDAVATGEPVFRRLAQAVTFSFAYRFGSEGPHDLSGTYRLAAVVSDPSGWKRTVELQPQTSFSGDRVTASGALDFATVQALIDGVERETGLRRQDYQVTIAPDVATRGTVSGREIREQFAPRLVFRLDALQLQLAQPGPRENDQLRPVQAGTAKGTHEEVNQLSILNLKLPVATARTLSLAGLGLSLLAALVLGLLALRTLGGDEAARIQARYGDLLMAVRGGTLSATGRTVELAAMPDLARLAEKTGHIILHETSGAAHRYLVQDGDVTYLYQTSPAAAETAESARDAV